MVEETAITATTETTLLESPEPTKPLWLPVGSVRALLALSLVAAVIAGFLFGLGIEGKDVLGLAGIALAFYFAGRTASQP